MDCMGQQDGIERWQHIVKAMNQGEVKGKGFDIQISGDSSLPRMTLVDSQKGITIGGFNMGRDELPIKRKSFSTQRRWR